MKKCQIQPFRVNFCDFFWILGPRGGTPSRVLKHFADFVCPHSLELELYSLSLYCKRIDWIDYILSLSTQSFPNSLSNPHPLQMNLFVTAKHLCYPHPLELKLNLKNKLLLLLLKKTWSSTHIHIHYEWNQTLKKPASLPSQAAIHIHYEWTSTLKKSNSSSSGVKVAIHIHYGW